LALAFRGAARYVETKYTCDYVRRSVEEFAKKAGPDADLREAVDAVRSFCEHVASLPDTVPTLERSGDVVARKARPSGPELYPAGSMVRVKPRSYLERFMGEWTWHHALTPQHLEFDRS
jgi:hypothetical protein